MKVPGVRKFHGTEVLGLFAPRERMFHGTKVSREQKFCLTLNMPSAAEECSEVSGNLTLSAEWSPWEEELSLATK